MEAKLMELARDPAARPGQRRQDDQYADTGRLLITCPDRPGIAAAVPHFLAASGASITESQRYPTGPFGGTFFLRLEFHPDGLGGRFGGLNESFAGLAGQ